MAPRILMTLLILGTIGLCPGFTPAEELINDGWDSGQSASFQGGFVSGEIGAVRLVPSISGTFPLQNIQLLFGGDTTAQNIILHVWDDSALNDTPGTELYSEIYQLQGSDDVINEIDLSSEGVMISGPIRIGIEFTHSGAPSIARDNDGTINSSRNFIKSGGAWYQSSLFGLTGDWIIRASTNSNASTFSVGGTVSGLTGPLTLQNNGGDNLIINSNGAFSFPSALTDGQSYLVTVLSPPAGQSCSVNNASGTINGSDITRVEVVCSGGSGGTQIVLNDGFVDGGEAAFQGGFVTGEIAAARLSPPGPDSWTLDLVQFLFGGATSQQLVTLKIWDDSSGAVSPGSELFTGDYLVTGGEALQQIDLSGEGLSISGDFRVGLLFQHDGYPSVARDTDGLQPDRNFIFSGSWNEAGSLGVTGDWIIRAQVSQQQAPEPFAITSIADFPNDQGRQVRIAWPNSSFDAPGSSTPVTGYALFRRIDPELKTYPNGDWDFLLTVPAFQETSYSTIVPTAADSTIVDGMYYSSFFIRAMTASTGLFFDSAVDSGYSVDNLVPQTPQNLFVAYSAQSGNNLSWNESADSDFSYFKIYRGTTSDFTIDPASPLLTTTSTSWQDIAGGFDSFYRVSAVDFSGNESPPTEATNTQVSGFSDENLPTATALTSIFPNPFNPSTTISFALPGDSQVRISIYDVSGRLVQTLVDQLLDAGNHDVVWQGQDSQGRAQASGIFFVRLETDRFKGTRRMVLVR